MDEPSISVVAAVGVVFASLLALLAWQGVLSARAFDDAPPRRGSLFIGDIAAVLGLLILGQGAGLAYAADAGLAPHDPQGRALTQMMAGYVGAIPAFIYLLIRATVGVEGGMAAFGFGLRNARRTLRVSFLGTPAIIVLAFGTTALMVQLSLWLGIDPPREAHEILRLLRENPQGPYAMGLIFGAVVLAPVLEEILFRGLLQTWLLQTGWLRNRWGVIVAVSVLFSLVHIGMMTVPQPQEAQTGAVAAAADETAGVDAEAAGEAAEEAEAERGLAWQGLPGLFVLSLGLGYFYERTGSLWPAVVAHAIFNFIAVTVVLYAPV